MMPLCTGMTAQKIVYTINYRSEMVRSMATMEVVSESEPLKTRTFIACNISLDSIFFVDEKDTWSYPVVPESIIKDPDGISTEFIADTGNGFIQVIIMDKFEDWFNNSSLIHKRLTPWSAILMIEIDKSGMPKMNSSGFFMTHYNISDITLPHYN